MGESACRFVEGDTFDVGSTGVKQEVGYCKTHQSNDFSICTIGLAALRRQLEDLQAERGVLLNGARMVASAALPFLEQRDKDHPTHNTGEVLRVARGAIARRTPETNDLIVAWMQTMKDEIDEQARVIGQLRERLTFFVEARKDELDSELCS